MTKTMLASWAFLFASTSCLAVQSQELTETKYHQLLAQLRPSEDELWRSIPWKISLLDAQRQAVEEGKPIFIWAMDGHPLGCT